ncbi:hypothetical protein D3C80_1353000 [compost metagenome]
MSVRKHSHAHFVRERVTLGEGYEEFHSHGFLRIGRLLRPHCLGGAGRRLMRHHRMHGVVEVLEEDLPVAIVHVSQHAAGHFEFAFGGAIAHVVDGGKRLAEELLEVRSLVIQPRENEAPVVPHMRHPRQSPGPVALLETGVLVALAQRDRQQFAIGLEGPRVVGTAEEFADVAAAIADDLRSLVGAAIHHHVNLAIRVSHHDHGLCREGGGEVVARVGHLAGMADVQPRTFP